MSIQDLAKLHPDQWDQIRDIYIPLSTPSSGGDEKYVVDETQLDHAIAYVGEIEPRLLYDEGQPESIRRLIEIFMQSDAKLQTHDKFRIEHNGLAYRAQRVMTNSGPVLAMRSLPQETPSLKQLVMPPACRALLMDTDLLHGGLFLICATNGQGKTTTCSAAVASRLASFSGLCNAVEDPPELPLAGWHGKGRCFQIPADADDADRPGSGYAKALLKTLRFFPSMPNGGTILLVGEVRDPRTAAETLLAAANGHLVLATIHAHSIPAALMRIATLAQATEEHMPAIAVQQLLAETLRGVIHQQLSFDGEGVGWSRGRLRCGVLSVVKGDTKLVDDIRVANWPSVGNKVDAQRKVLADIDEENAAQTAKIVDPEEKANAQDRLTAYTVKDRLKNKA